MAAYSNLVLRDDASTPVDHTLVPVPDNSPRAFAWRENLANVPIEGQVRLSGNWARLKNGDYKLTMKLECPTLETVGSANSAGYVAAPKVAYVTVGIFTMFAPARSTIQDRGNCMRMITHVMCGATATAGAGTGPLTAGGSVWTASTAAGVAAFVNLIFPS